MCVLIDSESGSARFSARDKDMAADLISAFTAGGIRIYQASFEKRELVEMFYEDRKDTKGAN